MAEMADLKWLRNEINDHAFIRTKLDEPKLPGDWRWQLLSRRVTYDLKSARAIAELFRDKITPDLPKAYQLCGIRTGGVPIIIAIQHFALPDVKIFSTRDENRGRGIKSLIDGEFDPALPVLIVDDVCQRGSQIPHALNILKHYNLTPVGFGFVLVKGAKYEDEFPIKSLFNLEEDFDRHHEEYEEAKLKPNPRWAGTE